LKNICISLRLTFWFSAIFLSGFIAFGIVMWLDLAYSLSHGRDRTLARRAGRLVDLLNASADVSDDRRVDRFVDFAEATPEGNLIHLFDSNGRRVLPKNPKPPDFPWPPASQKIRERYHNVVYVGRHFRVFVDSVRMGTRTFCILVAGQLEDNRSLLTRFSIALLASIPALMIISALGKYLLSRNVLRPIDRLTTAVQSISICNLSGRLPIGKTGDELQRLAVTCNGMLSRLEDSVSRIQRFTADASHELRSPISFVRMVAEVALRNPQIDAESRAAFDEILAESVDASRLLEDMLVLARADSHQNQLRFEAVDLADVLDEVRERTKALAEAKNQRLTIERYGSAPVIGDRLSLRRLLWTLVDNAVKYTPVGGHIELSLKKNGSEAHVIVRDSGIGIPHEMLPCIFNRFFRADPSRTQMDGAGLGLAIAKWIADIHNAVIAVESAEGRDTTFRVVFPVIVESAS
jgi:heavy metal sensor kinase